MAFQKSVQSKLITQLHSMMHSNKKVWCNIQHGRYETWMLHSHTPSWMKSESLSDRVRSITSHSAILQCLKLTGWLQTSLKLRTRLSDWINTICACALIMAHSASYFRSAFLRVPVLSQWLDFAGCLETANWQVRSRIASHTTGNRE